MIEGIGRSQTNWTDYCRDPPLGVCKGHVVAKRAICGRGPLRSWAGTLTENDHQAACSWRATGNVFFPPAHLGRSPKSKASPNLLSIDAARGHHRQRRLVAMRPVGGQHIGAQQGCQRR